MPQLKLSASLQNIHNGTGGCNCAAPKATWFERVVFTATLFSPQICHRSTSERWPFLITTRREEKSLTHFECSLWKGVAPSRHQYRNQQSSRNDKGFYENRTEKHRVYAWSNLSKFARTLQK